MDWHIALQALPIQLDSQPFLPLPFPFGRWHILPRLLKSCLLMRVCMCSKILWDLFLLYCSSGSKIMTRRPINSSASNHWSLLIPAKRNQIDLDPLATLPSLSTIFISTSTTCATHLYRFLAPLKMWWNSQDLILRKFTGAQIVITLHIISRGLLEDGGNGYLVNNFSFIK